MTERKCKLYGEPLSSAAIKLKFSIIYKQLLCGRRILKPALEIFIQPRKKRTLRSNGKPRLKNLLFSVFVAFSSSPLVEMKVSLVCVLSSQVNIVVLSPWFHSLQQSCLVKGFLEWNFVANQKRSRKSYLGVWQESRVSGWKLRIRSEVDNRKSLFGVGECWSKESLFWVNQ